jgi:predicted RNA-binding protein with PIN domain
VSHYDAGMALVRILVDGYSLLHNWPELARGKPRHSAIARDELVRVLTQYQDATQTPVTIFFDGSGARTGVPKSSAGPGVEVLFSKAGQTADDLIERAAHRFQPYGEVLAVTDDHAERDTVIALGGSVASCLNFIGMVENALTDLAEDLQHYNRAERRHYQTKR